MTDERNEKASFWPRVGFLAACRPRNSVNLVDVARARRQVPRSLSDMSVWACLDLHCYSSHCLVQGVGKGGTSRREPIWLGLYRDDTGTHACLGHGSSTHERQLPQCPRRVSGGRRFRRRVTIRLAALHICRSHCCRRLFDCVASGSSQTTQW